MNFSKLVSQNPVHVLMYKKHIQNIRRSYWFCCHSLNRCKTFKQAYLSRIKQSNYNPNKSTLRRQLKWACNDISMIKRTQARNNRVQGLNILWEEDAYCMSGIAFFATCFTHCSFACSVDFLEQILQVFKAREYFFSVLRAFYFNSGKCFDRN